MTTEIDDEGELPLIRAAALAMLVSGAFRLPSEDRFPVA
jgi:hypothetical protein